MAEQTTIWQYAKLSEYSVPGEPSTAAIGRLRRSWRAAVLALRRSKSEQEAPEERDRPSPETLAALLPRFDVEAAAGALAAALGEWPGDGGSAGGTRVVVGPPGARTAKVVAALARREGWLAVSPPERSGLLEEPAPAPLAELEAEPGRPAAIAELHRWLLRSERALPHMRALLAELRDPRRPLLVGCDSTAWSFLDQVLGVGDLLGEPLALAAFDASRLAGWLGPPLAARRLDCRPMDKPGSVIFGDSSPGPAAAVSSSPLARLASAARGNPGPALELWQLSLRLAKDGPEPAEPGRGSRQKTLWVKPTKEAEVLVPARLDSAHRLVLHAILLHGGLERELLPVVLPVPRHDLLRRLRDLGRAGLVAEADGEVAMPSAAYPAVRQYLDSEGFLVDAF